MGDCELVTGVEEGDHDFICKREGDGGTGSSVASPYYEVGLWKTSLPEGHGMGREKKGLGRERRREGRKVGGGGWGELTGVLRVRVDASSSVLHPKRIPKQWRAGRLLETLGRGHPKELSLGTGGGDGRLGVGQDEDVLGLDAFLLNA